MKKLSGKRGKGREIYVGACKLCPNFFSSTSLLPNKLSLSLEKEVFYLFWHARIKIILSRATRSFDLTIIERVEVKVEVSILRSYRLTFGLTNNFE